MTISFLILIAVPLGIYLLVMLLATRRFDASSSLDNKGKNVTAAMEAQSPVEKSNVEENGNPSASVASTTGKALSTNLPQTKEAERGKPSDKVNVVPEVPPKYVFDYRGRLWVEKKNRGFFRQLRRPHLPPDDPGGS
ncbi:MAG TPA: hypothetical protein VFD70_01905 [Anaerolineae bacterium]|nr:hypothetical protein [Anaerolineae bacterium]